MSEKRHSAATHKGPVRTLWRSVNSTARQRCRAITARCWRRRCTGSTRWATPRTFNPSRAFADATKLFFKNPANPLAHTAYGKSVAAAKSMELFERSTRRYQKPEWNIHETVVGAEHIPVHIKTIWQRPFCRLLHFERAFARPPRRPQPKLLIVAPMSGHYATLLRGTVETFLPNHDVYITEWTDARMVPLGEGRFDLDDYIDYVVSPYSRAGRRRARHRGLPAVGAGAGGGRADGGRPGSLRSPFHGTDGRADRHTRKSERCQ